MKTLVLGLGNPILTDDAVGLVVAGEVRKTLLPEDVTVSEASVGALGLMELVAGYDRAIIVDAISTKAASPGAIHRLSPEEFRGSLRAASTHDLSLAAALELGRQLGMHIPKKIVIFAIEAADLHTFGEELTPAVASAVPKVLGLISRELAE